MVSVEHGTCVMDYLSPEFEPQTYSCSSYTLTVVPDFPLEFEPYIGRDKGNREALSPLSMHEERQIKPRRVVKKVFATELNILPRLVRVRRCISNGVTYRMCDTRVI